jgi:hypothetical protein
MSHTKGNSSSDSDNAIIHDRNPELEVVLGQITIADFHAYRSRAKMGNKIAGYTHLGAGYYCKNKESGYSKSPCHHKGRQYRISITVQEISNE